MVGAWVLQTDFGNLAIKDVRTVGPNGKILPGTLYVPESATAENPAPAVVNIHGWWKSREAEQFLSLELARRGYVVFNIDMSGHGDNEIWDDDVSRGDDVYGALKMLEDIVYVDSSRIGATGHSSGGSAIDAAFTRAQEAGGVGFASLLFVGKDPTYRDSDGNYFNKYGGIDVGGIASQYDDWYYNDADENGEWRNAPRDFLKTEYAKSFVGFGDPSSVSGNVVSGQYYTEEVDGRTASRVLYNPVQIHSWNVLSPTVVKQAVEYFETTMPAASSLAPENQIGFLRVLHGGWNFWIFHVRHLPLPLPAVRSGFCLLEGSRMHRSRAAWLRQGNGMVLGKPGPFRAVWFSDLPAHRRIFLHEALAHVPLRTPCHFRNLGGGFRIVLRHPHGPELSFRWKTTWLLPS